MEARDYQLDALEAVFREWQKVRSTLVVMATGLGKTILFAKVIERIQPKRTLVIAHRKELIEQAVDKIYKATELRCGVEMGDIRVVDEDWWAKAPVVVATVQTLNAGNGKRMRRWKPEEFGLIVIDEAHHICADTYRKVIDYFSTNPDLKILGVTATPDRADEKALGQIFESTAFQFDILEGCNNGWLVPVTQQFCTVSSLDFSHVRTCAGDLNEGDLARIMEAEENVQGVCHPSLEVLYGLEPKTLSNVPVPEWTNYLSSLGRTPRRAIVFTVSVAQAEACSAILNRVVPDIAAWVCGKTPKDEREDILKDYQSGKVPVIVNCGVLTEGFDAPATEIIFMARPTKSRSLYCQMIGRSTRTLTGLVDGCVTVEGRKELIAKSAKPFCRIIDFAGNSGRHKLICALDVLGGKHDEKTIERAIEEAKESGKPKMVLKTLTNAEAAIERDRKAAIERLRALDEARRNGLVAKVDFHQTDVDPFGGSKLGGYKNSKKSPGVPASERQVNVLRQYGIKTAGLTKKKAGWVLSILADNDWMLPNQYKWLREATPTT